MIIGDAWNEKDEEFGTSFNGTDGWLLDNMLSEVGLSRRDCHLTSVFRLRPRPSNDLKNFCGPKAGALPGYPALMQGKYVRAEYAAQLERLYAEISTVQPNVIITMGTAGPWALLHATGIKSIRGAMAVTPPTVTARLGRQYKVLPTFAPGAVSRQWRLRPIVLNDLDKAKRHSDTPEHARPERHIWIEPTLEDIDEYDRKFIEPATLLSADIETKQDQITCIGFAPTVGSAIVIPFFSESGRNYWKTLQEELAAWHYVRKWLAEKPTLFQNGLYDINFLWSRYGIPVPQAAEDTMLLHHAYQPEMEKGLGFLATIYTDEASWKFMRKGMKHD